MQRIQRDWSGRHSRPKPRERSGDLRLDELPADVLMIIFAYVCTPFQLSLVGETCRLFLEVSRDPALWRRFCSDPYLLCHSTSFRSYVNARKIRCDVVTPRSDIAQGREARTTASLKRACLFACYNLNLYWDQPNLSPLEIDDDEAAERVCSGSAGAESAGGPEGGDRFRFVDGFSRKGGGMGALLDVFTKARPKSSVHDRPLRLNDLSAWHRMVSDDIDAGGQDLCRPGLVRSEADAPLGSPVGRAAAGVPSDVRRLIDGINSYSSSSVHTDLPSHMADILYRFLRLAPFHDGNGAVARLLMVYAVTRHSPDGHVPHPVFDGALWALVRRALARPSPEAMHAVMAAALRRTITDHDGTLYFLTRVRDNGVCYYSNSDGSVELRKTLSPGATNQLVSLLPGGAEAHPL